MRGSGSAPGEQWDGRQQSNKHAKAHANPSKPLRELRRSREEHRWAGFVSGYKRSFAALVQFMSDAQHPGAGNT